MADAGERELIRRLHPRNDLEALGELLGRAVEHDYLFPDRELWLAQGTVVGTFRGPRLLAVERLDDLGNGEGWISGIRVAPELRRRGMGRDLTRATLLEGRRRGLRVVRLIIDDENAPSRAMCASAGFVAELAVSHLHGRPRRPGAGVRAEVVDELPAEARIEATHAELGFAGYMVPTLRPIFRFVERRRERWEAQARAGHLHRFQEGGREAYALLGEPNVREDRQYRPITPVAGPLDLMLEGASRALHEERMDLSGFLPVRENFLELSRARGFVPGAIWGLRTHVYACDLSTLRA